MTADVPELPTARLVLRAPAPADVAPMARLADDLQVTRMTTRMPHPYTLADAEGFLERAADRDPAREITWTLHDAAGLIGVLGFFTDEDAAAPEIGYWLGRPAWGRGYASEAVAAALGWSDTVWRKPRLLAGCFTDNPASMRVLERNGFRRTDLTRRHSVARGADGDCQNFERLAPTA